MQLDGTATEQKRDQFEVWVAGMVQRAEFAAARDDSASLRRHHLESAEAVRHRLYLTIWEQGDQGRRFVPVMRRLNAAIRRLRGDSGMQ